MKLPLPILALGVAAFTSCATTPELGDQRPDSISLESLRSTVWIGFPSPPFGISGYASAVILGPNRLLTNAHAWSPEDPWYEAELPSERVLTMLASDPDGDSKLRQSRFRLIAAGSEPSPDSSHEVDQNLDDWVVIETDEPCWEEQRAVVIHPAARDTEWRVDDDESLLIVGFSSIFLDAEQGDDEATLGHTRVDVEVFKAFVEAGPYTVIGKAKTVEGRPGIEYPNRWPRPGGHSGGGVYLWNAEFERPELIGVFHSWGPTKVFVTTRIAPLGIQSLAYEHVSESEGRTLNYAPIAQVLASAPQP